jgi:predicted ATPase
LDDARVRAEEDRVEVLVDLGRHGPAATAADALRKASPLRERPVALAMRALYAGGRHAEALAAYAELRTALGEELGLEPSDELRDLEGRVLRHDLEVATTTPASPPPPVAPAGQRLPRPRNRLIGRAEDVARVESALAQARLVTLVGPGGTGKTRLSLEVVNAALDGAFVDLTRIDSGEDLARSVAAQLGVEQRTGQPPIDRLVEALHTHDDLLLVLDNCEHVLDDAARLADDLLGGISRLRILATSREALAAEGEQVVTITPLAADAAVDLLLERAGSAGVTVERDDRATDLCALVDHLPLGVELAAARLRTSSLDELRTALAEDRDALQGGLRTAADRHRSLDALVGWTYDDLGREDQAVLRALAVFAAPARAEDVAAVLGRDASSGLRRLVECSLAVRRERDGSSRFALLETVRHFGRRRLEELGELEPRREAHTAWAMALTAAVPTLTPEGPAAISHIDEVLDDIRQAFRTLVDAGDRARARRLVAPLWSYNLSRVNSQVYAWARELDDRWPASAGDPDPDGLRVTGIAAAGDGFGGALADALDRARRAIDSGGPPGPLALSYGALADAQMFLGDPAAATESYRLAVGLSEEAGEATTSTYGRSEIAMGMTYAEQDGAVELADHALVGLRRRNDPSMLAFGLYVAGEARLEADPDAAEPLLAEAVDLARRSGNRLVVGAAGLSHLSITARRDPRSALDDFPPLIEHWLRLGLWPQLWTTMRLVIEALAGTGGEAAAARLLGAQEASRRAGVPYGPDARRQAELRAALEARLGVDEVEALVAEGRGLGDEAAIDEALGALAQAVRDA